MTFSLEVVEREQIFPLRQQYLEELHDFALNEGRLSNKNCRFYLVNCEGRSVGYAAYIGEGTGLENTILEFYLSPECRLMSGAVFESLVKESGVEHLMVRSNDRFLLSLFHEFCSNPIVTSLHFQLLVPTKFCFRNLSFRPARMDDVEILHALFTDPGSRPFHWTDEEATREYIKDDTFWVLEEDSRLLGVGVMYKTIYQPQYVDIGMLVASEHRRKGYGAYIVQEITRVCEDRSLIPAAGCNADNVPSRKTLERAGYYPYDRYLLGEIAI